ncbi:MAG: hypothetical protein JJU42_02380 [Rhodobacteraceae bacterium]|nr:hypothetical protein [Paracoccaceae bacterium]
MRRERLTVSPRKLSGHDVDIGSDLLNACRARLNMRAPVLTPLASPRPKPDRNGDVVDATEKFWLGEEGAPAAYFVSVSAPGFPDSVAIWTEAGRRVSRKLSPRLARTVALPALEGSCQGRSFAVWPRYSDWSAHRPLRLAELNVRAPSVVTWLRDLARETIRPLAAKDTVTERHMAPLEYLAQEVALPDSVRRQAETELEFIENSTPALVGTAHHGDFWFRNILLDRSPLLPGAQLRVIDWGAARTDGYPFYDLMRFLFSMRLFPSASRARLLRRYASALDIDVRYCGLYLLSALGALGLNRDQFPLEGYVALVSRQHENLRSIRTR